MTGKRNRKRAGEVINFALYRDLRLTMHRPELAMQLVRDCPKLWADADRKLTATISRRREEQPSKDRKHRTQIAPAINLGEYRERRKLGDPPAVALEAVREEFRVGDLVRDRDGGDVRKVVAVEKYLDEYEYREIWTLGLEGEYGGEPMYEARFFVIVERGAA